MFPKPKPIISIPVKSFLPSRNLTDGKFMFTICFQMVDPLPHRCQEPGRVAHPCVCSWVWTDSSGRSPPGAKRGAWKPGVWGVGGLGAEILSLPSSVLFRSSSQMVYGSRIDSREGKADLQPHKYWGSGVSLSYQSHCGSKVVRQTSTTFSCLCPPALWPQHWV